MQLQGLNQDAAAGGTALLVSVSVCVSACCVVITLANPCLCCLMTSPLRVDDHAALRLYNMQRLLRGCIYGLCFSVSGLLLATECHRWPQDLLFRDPPALTPLSEAAIAHWILTVYEEHVVGATMVRTLEVLCISDVVDDVAKRLLV